MPAYRFAIDHPRPFFAEVPYYLWGQVNYDSEGDCRSPTDCTWTWLYVKNRETGASLEVAWDEGTWVVEGDDPWAARVGLFLCARCEASPVEADPRDGVGEWDHERAMGRRERLVQEFSRPELRPFDAHLFWGSWKWVGWFATEFTWTGRWIMHAVLTNDRRAVSLCVDWLEHGTVSPEQSQALRYVLNRLTGVSFETDQEWVAWYYGGAATPGHREAYPEPDFDAWLKELKAENSEG